MRWSIIRLIWFRELRDQLRDRRTILMIAVLPLLLYPILGMAVLQIGAGFGERSSLVGLVGAARLPAPVSPEETGRRLGSVASIVGLASAAPAGPGVRFEGLLALELWRQGGLRYPSA